MNTRIQGNFIIHLDWLKYHIHKTKSEYKLIKNDIFKYLLGKEKYNSKCKSKNKIENDIDK